MNPIVARNTWDTNSSTVHSSTNMLQILGKIRGSNSTMLQNTIEMAASSSKMLQHARETDRTEIQKKSQNRKNSSQNNSGPIYYSTIWYRWYFTHLLAFRCYRCLRALRWQRKAMGWGMSRGGTLVISFRLNWSLSWTLQWTIKWEKIQLMFGTPAPILAPVTLCSRGRSQASRTPLSQAQRTVSVTCEWTWRYGSFHK